MDEEQGWVPAAYLEREDGSQDDFANQPCEAGMSEMKLHLLHNFARLPSRKIFNCAQSPIFPYVRSSSTPTLTGDHLGIKCTRSSLAINLACGASAKGGEGDGEKKHFSTTLACFKRSDSEDRQSEQVKQRGGRVGV